MKAVLASFLLLVGHVAGLGCPTDPNISQACLDAVLPPPMVCAFSPGKTAQDYVDHAKDSATRCCGDDISACKCPVKDGAKFQGKIADHCKAVAEHCVTPEAEEVEVDVAVESAGLCPTDPNINQACLDAILPPPMVCAMSPWKTAQDWVDQAKDAATRCCGDDISACKCPVKGEAPFQAKIGDYCKAVAEDCDKAPEEVAVTAGYLRGGFDMEEQIQREEYAP